MLDYLNRTPIYIATDSRQKRKHKKRRINKKWLKRYGTVDFNYMPNNEIALIDGVLWMTKSTYEEFKRKVILNGGKRKHCKRNG